MIKLILITVLVFLNLNTYSFSNEVGCNQFKKFSISFMTCKANLIKEKTVSAGKNFVEDTKSYQKKEWSKEKDKLKNLKDKLLEK